MLQGEIPTTNKIEAKKKDNKIEVGTIKYQFLGSESSTNIQITDKKRLPTMTQKRLFMIAFSNPSILTLYLTYNKLILTNQFH